MKRPYIMEAMTVREMRQVLKKVKTVIVPLGCVEQHGYHLPLSTDCVIPYSIAKAVAEKVDCVVAPPLNYSFSGGTLPGTVNVSPQTTGLMVGEIAAAFAQQGFLNIVLLLGHGGTENVAAMKDAANMFYRLNPFYRQVLIAMVSAGQFSQTKRLWFKKGDFHAGFGETSLMMHFAPHLVRGKVVLDKDLLAAQLREHQDNYQKVARLMDLPGVVPIVTQRSDMKVGVMGHPEKASPRAGKQMAGEAVAGLAEYVQQLNRRRYVGQRSAVQQ